MIFTNKKFIIPLSIIGVLILSAGFSSQKEISRTDENLEDTLKVTILQTADIHGQLDTHPELFREEGEIVFKDRGGLAQIKTLFEQERQKNPNTIIVDGGDLIQGSGYAALSKGKVMTEVIKNMGYDVNTKSHRTE